MSSEGEENKLKCDKRAVSHFFQVNLKRAILNSEVYLYTCNIFKSQYYYI